MPMHDWTLVDAGIYHAFPHSWIEENFRVLNRLLPEDYYALPEQYAAGYGPDVLTLKRQTTEESDGAGPAGNGNGSTATLARPRPKTRFMAETAAAFYRRKQKVVAVRHVSDDSLVAVLEIRSPGNKSGIRPFRDFLAKTSQLLESRIHLLVVDPFPPTKRDPNGIHAAIWEEVEDQPFSLPPDKRLTLASYECDLSTRAYVETVAVGDPLPDMPLYLEPDVFVDVPLEATYEAAFAIQPSRWREVLE